MLDDPRSAFSQTSFVVDSLIRWVDGHPADDSMKILNLHRISYILSERDSRRSFEYYRRVAALSDSLHFNYGKALGNINLGILLSTAGDYEASTTAYLNAIGIAEATRQRRLEAICLNNVGENFESLKDHEKTRRYARMALPLNDSAGAVRGKAINYELIARSYLEEGRAPQARANLDSGLRYGLRSGNAYVLSQLYRGYGRWWAVAGQNDSAAANFDRASRIAQQARDVRNQYLVNLARAKYMPELDPRERIALASQAYREAVANHYSEDVSQAAVDLTDLYDKQGRRDSSMFYFRVYRAVNDSLFSERNRRGTVVNESGWILRKKEMENENLVQLTTAQRKEIAFRNTLLVVAAVVFGLALLVLFLIYKSVRAGKLHDESVYRQRIAEIEMQALRAQMNPHFFFNSLNSIENFIMKNEKKLASDYLNKFARFIRSVLDSSDSELIEVEKDLQSLQLYIDIERLRFNDKFTYHVYLDPRISAGDVRVPSLLVQPFLENAIIHGIGPSEKEGLKICLKLMLEGDMIHYTIVDNGVGRAQADHYNTVNRPHHKSVGMKITQERINIFNQGRTSPVKITDLYDDEGHPVGTQIDFSLILLSHATA